MGSVRLVERVAEAFSGVKIDREQGIVYGAKLCGFTSENGNDYLPTTFRKDFAKYDGAVVNFNHNLRGEPKVEDVGGRVRNPRVDADGTPRGDLHLLTSHPLTSRFLEAAEKDPGLYGLSHVAQCATSKGKTGRTTVEGLNEVESVDIVARPATTKGIFEGRGLPLTYSQLVEFVVRHPKSTEAQILKSKRLREDMGYDAPAMDAAPAPEMEPDEAISAGFKSAIMAVIEKAMSGDMDPKEAMKKVKKLLSGHGDATDTSADDMDDSDDTGDAGGDGVKGESVTKTAPDYPAILRECGEYKPGAIELLALAGLPTPEDRKAYIAEQLAKVPGETVKSAARKPGSGVVGKVAEQVNDKPVPVDGKTFAESIRTN